MWIQDRDSGGGLLSAAVLLGGLILLVVVVVVVFVVVIELGGFFRLSSLPSLFSLFRLLVLRLRLA